MSDLPTMLATAFGARFRDKRATLDQMADLNGTRRLDEITSYAIHHTAGPDDETVESLAAWFVYVRGWEHNAYHICVSHDPTEGDIVTLCVAETYEGFGVHYRNHDMYDICVIGDYTGHPPRPQQIADLKTVCDVVDSFLGHQLPRVGHRDVTDPRDGYTACPGDTAYGVAGWLKQIQRDYEPPDDLAELRARIMVLEAHVAELLAEVARFKGIVADVKRIVT